MIKIIYQPSGTPLFVIREPNTSVLNTVYLSEAELDELQQRIMQVKADLYKQRKEKPPFYPDYPCCTD